MPLTDTPLRKQPSLWDQTGTAYQYSPASRAFWAFHIAHPEVYAEIVRRGRLARARGFTQYSIRDIWGSMRWEFDVAEGRPGERIVGVGRLNNNHTPFYADLIMAQEPELAGFFKTRRG